MILLQPFAPHLAEELWAKADIPPSDKLRRRLAYAPWPKFDPALLVESEIEIPVQVNGKFRDVIKIAVDADNATIEAAAKASEKVQHIHRRQNDQESHHRAEEDGEFDCGLKIEERGREKVISGDWFAISCSVAFRQLLKSIAVS